MSSTFDYLYVDLSQTSPANFITAHKEISRCRIYPLAPKYIELPSIQNFRLRKIIIQGYIVIHGAFGICREPNIFLTFSDNTLSMVVCADASGTAVKITHAWLKSTYAHAFVFCVVTFLKVVKLSKYLATVCSSIPNIETLVFARYPFHTTSPFKTRLALSRMNKR